MWTGIGSMRRRASPSRRDKAIATLGVLRALFDMARRADGVHGADR